MLTEDQVNSTNYVAGGMATTYDIPIHLYITYDEEGNPSHPYDYALEFAAIGVEIANNTFPEEMNFYICAVTPIVDDDLFNVEVSDLGDFCDYASDDEAINVYISKLNYGRRIGCGIYVGATKANTVTLAHELGHYFSLYHTFARTVEYFFFHEDYSDPCIQLTPESECIESCNNPFTLNDFCIECENGEDLCDCRGDNICDTNVDPGTDFCDVGSVGEPCVVTIDGLSVEYFPDYKNIMSYYSGVREHFSQGQKNRMLNNFLSNPSKAFLHDEVYPECENLEINTNIFFPEQGRVEAVKKNEFGEYYYPPFPDVRMKLINSDDDLSCVQLSSEDGYYKTLDSGENSTCGNIMPDYLADVNIEVGRCHTQCPQLDVANGVSTLDLNFIYHSILGNYTLKKPYAYIAADVNYSGTITVSDLIEIRKLILGYIEEFEDVPSWRFLPVYALEDQWAFKSDFDSNPFTAVWNIEGEQREYMPNGTYKSYLDRIDLNLLNEDVTHENTWSFRGIKSGDVTFNADIDPGFIPESPGFLLSSVPHDCLEVGEEFTVLFKSSGSNWGDLQAYQIGMRTNPHVATIKGVNAGVLPGFTLDNFNVEKFKLGELRTLWYNEKTIPESLSSDEVLFKLHLTANTPICDISNVFEFNDSLLVNQIYGIHGNSKALDIKLEVIEEGRKHSLKSVYPNPSSNQLSFEFELDNPETVTITLMDQNGNIQQETNQFIQGEQIFIISNTCTLQPGVITYMISLGTELNSGNLIKM